MAETKNVTVKNEETVKIKLPRGRKEDGDVFVSVNERTWLIKRGIEVEVPTCVAEVLEHQEQMQEEAYNFDSEIQN